MIARRWLPMIAVLAVAFGMLAFTASPSAAQVRVGGQMNFSDDFDVGLGPRVAFDLPELADGLSVLTSFDIFFPGRNVNYWELNGNLRYTFTLEETPNLRPYAGGGLNIGRISLDSPGGSDTDVGVNFLGGLEFPTRSVTPFVELRIVASGGDHLVLSGGLLVP